MPTKTLNCAKLTDKEQREKKTPDKFLDRLQEGLCNFTDVDPESTEEGMILKIDFSLSQLQISVFKKLYSWPRRYTMVKNKRRKIGRKKKTWQKTKATTMAVRSTLKQPEEKCPEEPRWEGVGLLLLWKGGASQVGLPSGI